MKRTVQLFSCISDTLRAALVEHITNIELNKAAYKSKVPVSLMFGILILKRKSIIS
jgi:hypothetical protein